MLSVGYRRRWRAHQVAFGEFTLRRGDAYIIPAGVPHEFRNDAPSLSIAWNFLQPGARASELCAAITQFALDEVSESGAVGPLVSLLGTRRARAPPSRSDTRPVPSRATGCRSTAASSRACRTRPRRA